MIETESYLPLLPDSAARQNGRLSIGGVDLASLYERFGTPVYAYDEATLRNSARAALEAFPSSRVSYAAKACALTGVLRVFQEEGLGVDTVSLGEMVAAQRAGFGPNRIHLHGNAKSNAELAYAVDAGVHAIVADNLEELAQLDALTHAQGERTAVMLRLNLPLEARTHPHLQTTGGTSKFGFPYPSPEFDRAQRVIEAAPYLDMIGIHVHLGSQIDDLAIFADAATTVRDAATRLCEAGFTIEEVSVGGGWAVPYRPGDPVCDIGALGRILNSVFAQAPFRSAVEPGRALVARAGVAIYTVVSVKVSGGRRLIAVDGGMGDNPRPALYGASYSALPVAGTRSPTAPRTDVVGRYCEAGDILARDLSLPELHAGDLLCVPVSGAYQLAMAGTYNLVPQPAAVLVGNGETRLLARRATLDDLFSREQEA